MAALVDLSLFAESPTHDGNFSINSTPSRPPIRRKPVPSTYPIPPNMSAMESKPLPPLPGAQRVRSEPVGRPSTRFSESNSSRFPPERPRAHRSMAQRPSYSALPSPKPMAPAQTLQERRKREPMALPLASTWSHPIQTRLPQERIPMTGRSTDTSRTNSTAPTMTSCRTMSTTTSVSTSSTRSRSNDSMVWLQDDNVWLVEDRALSQGEQYGFYAPDSLNRYSRSRMSRYPSEPPPTYHEAVAAAEADKSSPVRDQFLSLMKAPERPAACSSRASSTLTNMEHPSVRSHNGLGAPSLQEAMSGISFFPRSEALMPGEASPTVSFGNSSPQSLVVSPLTTTAPNPSRWFNRPDTDSLGSDFPDFNDWPMPPLGK